ncbi:MAG: class A beta-lactamase [Bacteroidales bacterium]|nr:class A beta-lactamase [Bacteroidales bacterium]
MKELFLFILAILLLSSCKVSNKLINISGLISCEDDSTVLVHPFITRLSDGQTFIGDDKGHYVVDVMRGDTLVFSYVGAINDTVVAKNSRLDVKLKPYNAGKDEYIFVDKTHKLQEDLNSYISGKDARIGIAVIVNGKDTISVNGNREFPMMSVFKFPLALAVSDYCLKNDILLSDSISIKTDAIKENTWSPMRDKYGVRDLKLPISELLDYILQQSDNNACDILIDFIGGTSVADKLMKSLGYHDIIISHTEDEMHRDLSLSYLNRTTPIAMARLFDQFYRQGMRHENVFHDYIAESMLTCQTGLDRLPAPLLHSNAIIGHKTGTGDINSQGRIIAVNDAGYIIIPNKSGYSIAVFVADSGYDMAETSKIIAEISKMVFNTTN